MNAKTDLIQFRVTYECTVTVKRDAKSSLSERKALESHLDLVMEQLLATAQDAAIALDTTDGNKVSYTITVLGTQADEAVYTAKQVIEAAIQAAGGDKPDHVIGVESKQLVPA